MTPTPKIDRTGWPPGPWDHEPDRVEWRTAAGFPALVQRVGHGALCGYVAVPPGHPAHGRDYYDPDAESNPLDAISVHGGITYTAACEGRVCHVPEPGEPDDVWWIGFDCAHYLDAQPLPSEYRLLREGTYRTVEYVRAECERLAAQLREVGP